MCLERHDADNRMMTIWHLVKSEMLRRKVTTVLALVSISAAAAALVGAVGLLHGFDMRTRQTMLAKEAELQARLDTLDATVSEAMNRLGFNIVILPYGQDLGDWFAQDVAAKTMPQEYVRLLQRAGLTTIGNLVPRIKRKVQWTETGWTVLVAATGKAESAQSGEDPAYIGENVPRGKVALGHEIHRAMGLRQDDEIRLLARRFVVDQCLRERGNTDDITVWLNLQDAQELLGLEGRISEILAVQRRNAWRDLPKVREELARVLPDTQAIEIASEAQAKTQARNQVEQRNREALAQERDSTERVRAGWVRTILFLVPAVSLLSIGWLWLLASGNVRCRRQEIGILRALGFHSRQISMLFLLKFGVIGLLGGGCGYVLGGIFALGAFRPAAGVVPNWGQVAGPQQFAIALIVSLAVTLMACIGPVVRATRQDAAEVLREQ